MSVGEWRSFAKESTRRRGTFIWMAGKGYSPCLLDLCNSRRLEARSFTRKRDEWKSINVLVSLVNLWTDNKWLEISGTCKTLFKRKVEVEIKSWVVPMWWMGKLVPLPTRICSKPWYSSARTFKLARSKVTWCVALESRYQLGSVFCLGVARRAYIWGVLSYWYVLSKRW